MDTQPIAYKLWLAKELTKTHQEFGADEILEEDEKILGREKKRERERAYILYLVNLKLGTVCECVSQEAECVGWVEWTRGDCQLINNKVVKRYWIRAMVWLGMSRVDFSSTFISVKDARVHGF